MKTKTLMAFALTMSALAVSTTGTFAQTATNTPSSAFSLDFTSQIKSEYVSPFDKLLYNKPVIQSELTLWADPKCMPGKFYFGFWNSESFHGMNANPGDEIDYKLGWKGELWNGINLNLRTTYLDFVPIGAMPGGRDQIRFMAEFDRKFGIASKSLFGDEKTKSSITPFVQFVVPWGLRGYKDRSGLWTYLGAKGDWEFMPHWAVCQKANLFVDDGAIGLQPGKFFDYSVALGWQANRWLRIEPFNFRIMTPIDEVRSDCRKTEKIYGAGFQASF